MKNLNILDCTLRDGGYYNNWKFSSNEIKKYLKGAINSNIDIIEIGFHFFDKNTEYGRCAHIDETYLKKFRLKKNNKISIMFNASDLIKQDSFVVNRLNKVFNSKKKIIDIVRIATHSKDLNKIKKYLDYFKNRGLKICLNLMQINTVSKNDLKNNLKLLSKWKNVDVFYFADSFGNLKPKDVKNICSTIKSNWNKEFGIHSHNNCKLALKNSIMAFKNGANWIDGTIQGMGRGAGNVKTEDLLKYFKNFHYKPDKLSSISKGLFFELKKKFKWGPSNFYKIAAKFNIHPTYIQTLLMDSRYKKSEIKKSILNLSKLDSKGYDPRVLEKISAVDKNFKGKWNAKNWCKNRNIIILGQGESLKENYNLKEITKILIEKKPIVLSLNINNFVPEAYIDYFVSSTELRILTDHKLYSDRNKNLIIPNRILNSISKFNTKNKIYDYGIKIQKNTFKALDKYAILPINLSYAYCMALCIIGGANKIFLAGFDGYGKNYKLQNQMLSVIKLIKKNYKKIKLISLTKTQYRFK